MNTQSGHRPYQGPAYALWWLVWAFIMFWPTILIHGGTERLLVEGPWIGGVVTVLVLAYRKRHPQNKPNKEPD